MDRLILTTASVLAAVWLGVHVAYMLGAFRPGEWLSFCAVFTVFPTLAPAMLHHPAARKHSPPVHIRLRDVLRGAPRSIIALLFSLLVYVFALGAFTLTSDDVPDMTALFTVGATYMHVGAIVLVLSGRAQREVSGF